MVWVSWLFLAVSLWGAWFTYNALRPTIAGPRIAALSFAAGWLTSELALHHVGWQAVATLAFGWAGAFAHWPGQVGLAITLLSWVGLLVAQRQSARAGESAERALQSALGSDYRSRITPELRAKLSEHIDWRRVLMPFPIRHKQVEKIRDLQFARAQGIDLRLDVYRHESHPDGCPVLLQIHGGAWVIGDKREQALPLMNTLASKGWVCVSANYRLSPHATFPDHLIDCKRALAWISENIADYGGDPNFVVVTGGSAGGHLAALVGLTANQPEYQPGFSEVDTRVRACVPFYGVYDFKDRHGSYPHEGLREMLARQVMKGAPDEIPEAWESASPITLAHADAPPTLAVHGDRDTLVPIDQARHFVAALREKSRAPVAFAEIPGAQHAFEIFPSLRTLRVNDAVERFLAVIYSDYLASRGSADSPLGSREPTLPAEGSA